jgi:hypothetical protein
MHPDNKVPRRIKETKIKRYFFLIYASLYIKLKTGENFYWNLLFMSRILCINCQGITWLNISPWKL